MDQRRQSLTLDVYLIYMFITILKYKSDQLNKTSRHKYENKIESTFDLEPQSFLVYPISKTLKIQRYKYNL